MSVIALSCGEPSGIGADIVIDAWLGRREAALPPFYLLGDAELVLARARRMGRVLRVEACAIDQAEALFDEALPVVALETRLTDRPGHPLPDNAPGVIEAIERGVDDVVSGRADALVTAPIAKKPLYDAGFTFPGHTEFLGHLAEARGLGPSFPVMMIAGPELRVVPVTIHIALSDVPKALSAALIVRTCEIAARDLTQRFGVARPRLAVTGLNPHAGEGGTMGTEEIGIIEPAIEALRSSGFDVAGPLPADTMFHAAARARYDVAICMYHDQALIPAKALAFDESVNVTLGLPFIRTSPDHGTAFDLAGTGRANPSSLIAAVKMARAMADFEAAAR